MQVGLRREEAVMIVSALRREAQDAYYTAEEATEILMLSDRLADQMDGVTARIESLKKQAREIISQYRDALA